VLPVAASPILDARPGEFNFSQQCGTCHRDIQAAWKTSAHALAVEDPLFLDALRELSQAGGDVRVCLGCHAPTTALTRDFNLDRKISWEGVTCDYCHSIAAVGASPRLLPSVKPGDTKFGPIRDAASGAHKTEYRDYFTASEICANCHDYTSPAGLAVLTTYSDWKASPQAARGRSCQDCHMSQVQADVVDPKVQRVSNAAVNLHSMPGGHTIEQLNRAISVQARVARKGDVLTLDIDLLNNGAGHSVPTGSAARQVALEIRVDTSGGHQQQATRVYQRVLADAAGVPLFRDRDLFTRATKVQSDTRIKAGETRKEHFEFDIGSGTLANVKVHLVYRNVPEPQQPPTVSQVFYTQSWTLPPS
jgi:hypothetical protein